MTEARLTPDQKKLRDVGVALFGERYQGRLAALLGVPQSRVSMMLSGDRPVPADIDTIILAGLRRHAGDLAKQAATVERLIARFSSKTED